jgi:hypothetical protein
MVMRLSVFTLATPLGHIYYLQPLMTNHPPYPVKAGEFDMFIVVAPEKPDRE